MQNANEQNARGYTTSRILALSPEANETIRRNFSRIFVLPAGEGTIDSILFQGSRPVENYMEVVTRAIAEAGLKPNSNELHLRPSFDPKLSVFLQSFIATNSWLIDESGEAFDLYIEINTMADEGTLPEMETYDAHDIDGVDFENPLCFKVGLEKLSPQWEQMAGGEVVQLAPRLEPEVAERNGGQGQVKNPSTDRRLKENRPEQMATARHTQDRLEDESENTSERMTGKPGRVRFRGLDGRLKSNRRQMAMEGAGGR